MKTSKLAFLYCCLLFSSGYRLVAQTAFSCDHVNKKDIVPKNTRQLLVVDYAIAGYKIYPCQKDKGIWMSGLPSSVVSIGKKGIIAAQNKMEGDLKTPAGLYLLGTAFGTTDLRLRFPYRKLTIDDKFVDDINSKQYNRWVRGKTDAASYEPMLKYYRYGIVINYNMDPVIPGKGSAIFIHNWSILEEPTSGCIAMAESNLITILRWLNKKSNPMVLILPATNSNNF